MRSNRHLHGQRGFTLIEAMSAAMVLSIFIVAVGACWVVSDRRINDLMLRQQAVFAANAEMERLTVLYDTTSFGVLGPTATTGYDGPSYLPANRLTYPTSATPYSGGPASEFIVTTAANFQSGDTFQVFVNSQLVPALNRAYLWLDQGQGVMARVSWKATNITPAACVVGGDGCWCLGYIGTLGLGGNCQRIDLYLEYPYRLVSGSPTAGAPLQTVVLSSIVGRHS